MAAGPNGDRPVYLTVGKIEVKDVHAGDTAQVNIPVTVAKGFHVNANPASSEDYIPLEVTLNDSSGLKLGSPVYPKGKKWRLEGTTEDLLVYSGTMEIRVPVVVSRETEPGAHVVAGLIDYQACNNQVCFMPESRPISITLNVVPVK
jgi:uncharacterized protein